MGTGKTALPRAGSNMGSGCASGISDTQTKGRLPSALVEGVNHFGRRLLCETRAEPTHASVWTGWLPVGPLSFSSGLPRFCVGGFLEHKREERDVWGAGVSELQLRCQGCIAGESISYEGA